MFVEAGGNPAELFEFAKEPLYQIALAVDVAGDAALEVDPALRRDMRLAPAFGHKAHQRHAVVAAIRHHLRWRQRGEQQGRGGLVGRLPGVSINLTGKPS